VINLASDRVLNHTDRDSRSEWWRASKFRAFNHLRAEAKPAPPDQHAEEKVSVCQATSCEMSRFVRSGRNIAETKVTAADNRI
jgi:hypothetical protein